MNIDLRTLVFAFDDVSRRKLDTLAVVYQNADVSILEVSSTTTFNHLIIAAEEFQVHVKYSVELFLQYQGHLPKFITVVHDNPSEELMNQLYEFDVDQFVSYADLRNYMNRFSEAFRQELNNPIHPLRIVKLAHQSLMNEGQKEIAEAAEQLLPHAQYSCDAAVSLGKSYEALGDFVAATTAYKQVLSMQPRHRIAIMSLAECLLVQQKPRDSLVLLLELERENSKHPARKALLTAVYSDLNDIARAEACVAEAVAADPSSARTREAQAHVLIADGNLQEALRLVSSLGEIGPFLTSKLNEVGIKLSQAGRGADAILLYSEAHKIVRHDLKYKISMNAALAAHRNHQPDVALAMLDRCEQEYGARFPKLDKIRAVVEQSMQQRTSSDKKAAS